MRARILLTLAALPLAAFAQIVVVYSLSGDRPPVSELRQVAKLLSDPATVEEGKSLAQAKAFGYKTAEGNQFTAVLAAPTGAYAYYWSDGPAILVPGFKPTGGVFENPSTGAGIRAGANPADGKGIHVFKDAFSARLLAGKGLHVAYSIASPGPVVIEVFGMNGRSLARWRWTEVAAGTYSRDLAFGEMPGKAQVFVRYSVGKARAVHRLTLTGARP